MTNSLFDTSLTAHLELFSTLQTVRPAVEAAAERMKAAIAAGADGIIIECHPNPATALSDGHQALLPAQLHDIVKGLRRVAEAVGRTL